MFFYNHEILYNKYYKVNYNQLEFFSSLVEQSCWNTCLPENNYFEILPPVLLYQIVTLKTNWIIWIKVYSIIFLPNTALQKQQTTPMIVLNKRYKYDIPQPNLKGILEKHLPIFWIIFTVTKILDSIHNHFSKRQCKNWKLSNANKYLFNFLRRMNLFFTILKGKWWSTSYEKIYISSYSVMTRQQMKIFQ